MSVLRKSRVLCVVMVLAIIATIIAPIGSFTASAAEYTEGDYVYTVSNGEATIKKYKGAGGDVTIPTTLGGYPVTTIGDYAFSKFSLTSVSMPSVTTIGDAAFRGCTSLTSVSMPSATTIGDYVFMDSGLISVNIPKSFKSLGFNPFAGCTNLLYITVDSQNPYYSVQDNVLFNKNKTELVCYPEGKTASSYVVPSTVTIICEKAFGYNQSLTNVSMPNVVTIGDGAFLFSYSLESVEAPKATTIGNATFYACDSLQSVSMPNVTTIGSSAFYKCNLTTIDMPKVTTIDGCAFYCNELTSINMPKVTSVGDECFMYCFDLESVSMPNVTKVGEMAFAACQSLKNITMPNLTIICDGAFGFCTSLTSIILPKTVSQIDTGAFTGCDNLWHILYTGTEKQWNSIQIEEGNNNLLSITRHYNCTGSEITDAANKKCSICSGCAHTWDGGKVTKEATCKEVGVKTYTCAKCSATKTEDIAKLDTHSYGSEWSNDGTSHWHECSTCKDKKDLAVHTPVSESVQKCSVCGGEIKQGEESVTDGKILKKVFTYTSLRDEEFYLNLLDVDGVAYILSIDALEVSDYDEVEETDGGAIYSRGESSVKYTGNVVEYNGDSYYELRELMNLLNVRYDYVDESQTMLFNAATSFKDDLIEYCDAVYDYGYGLDYLDNPVYYWSGAIYNIMGGKLFDFISGDYQMEQRQSVVSNIMSIDEDDSPIDLLNKADSFIMNANKVYKGIDSVTKGIEGYSDLLDCPTTEFLDAYGKVAKGGNVFGFSDFLDIAQLAFDAQHAYSTYVTAVECGLLNNAYVEDKHLKTATKNVYTYYEQESHVFADMFVDTVKTAGNNAVEKITKELVKNALKLKLNNSLIKAIKVFTDEVLNMKDMTAAVEKTHICAIIQEAAIKKYNSSNDVLTKKYCTILYVRACQYAYSLYEFDSSLSPFTEFWKEKTGETLETLIGYSDAELSRTVDNKQIDMTHAGFVVVSGS